MVNCTYAFKRNARYLPSKQKNILGIFFILLSRFTFAQSWTELTPSGAPPVARTGTTGVYDPTSNRMIVFGGRDANGNNRNDVWALTHANGEGATGQWIRFIPNGTTGSPPARSGHSAVYDSVNNRMIIFGGCSANCAPVLSDVWVLTNANGIGGTPAWTQLSPGYGPAARANSAAAYDAADNQLIIFGGQDGSADPCSTFTDVWVLTTANGLGDYPPTWSLPFDLEGPYGPPGQNGASSAYDTTTNVMSVFGGTGMVNGICQATNALWQLTNVGSPYWGNVIIPGGAPTSPAARSFGSAAYDASGGRMLMFGGVDGSGNYLNDVWSLANATGLGSPVWTMLNPTGGPPVGRSGEAAAFDSVSRRMTIFGGSNASGVLSDSWVLTSAPGVSGLSCSAESIPNIVPSESIAGQVGDVVLNCTGGRPTPEGEPIPEYWITLTLDTDVTSSLLPGTAGLSEALLMIDDPFPANPVPSWAVPGPNTPPQILCTPLGSYCGAIGTGGTPSPYETQPNVYVGKQDGATELYWKIPIDPPGVNLIRKIRLTNVLANASQLGLGSVSLPIQLPATLKIQGTQPVPIANPQQDVGVSQQGVIAGLVSNASIPQCEPHNAALLGGSGTAAFDFSLQAAESFFYAFRFRNYGTIVFGTEFPQVLAEQNVPGFVYRTETGFYSPSLFTTAPTLGLANFGTRLLVSVGPVSSGTKLFVPTTITLTGDYAEGSLVGQLQLIQANEYGNSASGYEPVASTAMIGTTPLAEAYSSGSRAYAVYEVIYADPSVQETATIPVAVAFTNVPSTGEVQALTTLAPLSSVETASETASIPRFKSFSTAQEAYSITSCTAP